MPGLGLSLVGKGSKFVEDPIPFTGHWWKGPWCGDVTTSIEDAAVVAAWQPKWANNTLYFRTDVPNYANSKINLDNPGTHDAINGISNPTFDPSIGWTSAGASYLDTDVIPASDRTWSMVVAFSGLNIGINTLIGCGSFVGGITARFGIQQTEPIMGLPSAQFWNQYFRNTTNLISPTEGVLGLSGVRAYSLGVYTATLLDIVANGNIATTIAIMAENDNGIMNNIMTGSWVAGAIYNRALSAIEIAAVSRALEIILLA
jgi:hypothetical protein